MILLVFSHETGESFGRRLPETSFRSVNISIICRRAQCLPASLLGSHVFRPQTFRLIGRVFVFVAWFGKRAYVQAGLLIGCLECIHLSLPRMARCKAIGGVSHRVLCGLQPGGHHGKAGKPHVTKLRVGFRAQDSNHWSISWGEMPGLARRLLLFHGCMVELPGVSVCPSLAVPLHSPQV